MSDNNEEYCTCSRHTNKTLHIKGSCEKKKKDNTIDKSKSISEYLSNAQKGVHDNHRITTMF